MIDAPHLQTLADSARLTQGPLHWMIGVHGLYVYGGLLKRIFDETSTVALGDVDVIVLDEKIMHDMTTRFGIVFRKV
jgi:cellobiose-specific phosphotransferase system component IIC